MYEKSVSTKHTVANIPMYTLIFLRLLLKASTFRADLWYISKKGRLWEGDSSPSVKLYVF